MSQEPPQPHAEELAEAAILQWTWKTPAMKAMSLAVLKLAIERGGAEFSANDLPEFDHGGRGIAGVIFHRLQHDGVISPVGHFDGTQFFPKTVRNAGGNRIGIYRLKNYRLALRALAVHSDDHGAAHSAPLQKEMALA